jgi:hypothetical protein
MILDEIARGEMDTGMFPKEQKEAVAEVLQETAKNHQAAIEYHEQKLLSYGVIKPAEPPITTGSVAGSIGAPSIGQANFYKDLNTDFQLPIGAGGMGLKFALGGLGLKTALPVIAAGARVETRLLTAEVRAGELLSVPRNLVRTNLPKLPKSFAREFDGPVSIRTFKAGDKLYRSPWVPDELASNPGAWFGTRRTTTQAGTDSMFQITKWGNPNSTLRAYELTQDVTGYYGKVKGGTGYQALFPKDVTPGDVLKFIGEAPLK